MARNELAATLTSWAVARSVSILGVPSASVAAYTSSRTRAARAPPSPGTEAVDQPVRVHRVLDGVALAEELRVPDQLGGRLALLRSASATASAVPTGHGGLADHDVARLEQRQDAVDRGADVGEVGGVLAALLGRADADEVHDRVRGARGSVVNSSRPVASASASSSSRPGSWNGGRPAASAATCSSIDVDAHHLVAERGHAGGVDGAEVAAAEDGDPHAGSVGSGRRSRARRRCRVAELVSHQRLVTNSPPSEVPDTLMAALPPRVRRPLRAPPVPEEVFRST